jgi:hypothetical protein
MPHCTPEDIALAALGEELPAPDAAHLTGCADCRAEVASLQRAVHLLGDEDAAGPPAPVPLPPRVWDAIAAGTGVRSRPASVPQPDAVLPQPRSGADGPATMASTPTPTPTVPPPAAVPDLAAVRGRRRPRWATAVAVAASLLVGAGLGAVAVRQTEPAETVAAAADLEPLPGWSDTGAAVLLDRDGELELQVDLPTPPAGDGFYEVWLLGTDSGAVALGVLESGSGRFPVPAGVDLAAYGTVDVSREPLDGDPAHSTDSVARGALT